MAIVVEHDKRKHEILEKSFELFCREGYEDVTFQKIADACGITRTTLYIYFKNKREIFTWSIKQLTEELEAMLLKIIEDDSLNSEQCLRKTLEWILDACTARADMFNVLLQYVMQLRKDGSNPAERVRRRVLRVQHLLSMMIIRGQKSGEFKKIPVKQANELLYSLLESAIFRIAVLAQTDITAVKISLNLAVDGLLVQR
ncbi:MAG: TetR/AcrR family transcriptional regulator [Treponema sp.]|nr:TetR/AcrR family transcriptional regulator [Treponema sp.]